VSTVGFPRALLDYRYGPMWRAFFEALGVEVLVSALTTSKVLAEGTARVVPETCLPVKIYCGHVLSLVGRVDCVFVPAIHSLRFGTRNCPKLIGLPDLIANAIPDVPLLTIDVENESLWPSRAQLALSLGKHTIINPLALKGAIEQARTAHRAYQDLLVRGVDPHQALRDARETPGTRPAVGAPGTGVPAHSNPVDNGRPNAGPSAGWPTVAVVGHPYTLYDDYVTHRLLARLCALNVRVRTSDSVRPASRWGAVERLGQIPYWTFEDEIVGAGGSLLNQDVDGLISVSAFGCAPDSVMLSVLSQAAQRADVPYMSLILDEHSGQAGLVTRLEAFVDMLYRRKEKT
jgi:predicted nucleotide-binding protein (sugar kinase/HSP70/actin superfamily)